jgi:hypothetical protein
VTSIGRIAIVALFVLALAARSPAEPAGRGQRRPAIRAWASALQSTFMRLPYADGSADPRAGFAAATCVGARDVLESARRDLFPTPTAAIDRAFTEYVGALLDLYRECPQDAGRAAGLHERANRLGSRLESLVNRALDEDAARRTASGLPGNADGI